METAQILFLTAALALALFWIGVALTGRRRASTRMMVAAELHYGRFLRLFALVTALCVVTLTGYVVSEVRWRSLEQLCAAAGAFLALSGLGGLLLLETEKTRLYLTEDALIGESPWRRRRVIRWDEVQRVRYSGINRWFIIEGPAGQTIRVSRYLVGLPQLLAALQTKAHARCSAQVQAMLR